MQTSMFALALVVLAVSAAAVDVDAEKTRDAAAAAMALNEEQPALDDAATAFVETGAQAQWRFGSNYVPQHYGNWQFQRGTWNFGNDKRIECEACGYVLYMLIDRLGDEFDKSVVNTEMGQLCGRVQWVFRSACDYIFKKHKPQIVNSVMRLTEPEDICKQLAYCAPDFYDAAVMGGMRPTGYGGHPGMGMHPGAMYGHGVGAGVGAGMGGMGFDHNGLAVSMAHPRAGGMGGAYGVYPAPGSHPMSPHSPYSPYSFGGYDPFGYPLPHPGVPSSTPPPAAGGEAAKR